MVMEMPAAGVLPRAAGSDCSATFAPRSQGPGGSS